MALKADSQGFLIGEVVSDIRRNNDQLTGIRADVRDIKSALLSAMNSGGKGSKNAKIDGGAKIASPISRRASDSGASKAATPAMSKGAPNVLPPVPKKAATPNGRDASTGKFTAKNAAGGGIPTPNIDDKKSQSLISSLAGRITSTAAGAAAGAEEADPAIKAFKEVSEPMMRGYQTLFGGGDKKERWYKKIFKELNLFRKDESVFNKAEAKVLKNIEAKPSGGTGNGSSGGGLFTTLLSKIPLLKNLLPSMSPTMSTAASAGGIGSKLLRGGKGLLRKIPFLGALIGGASTAADVYGNEEDGSLTRGEKDNRNGKSVGGFAGSVGGMMAGAAAGSLLGPVGTVVGGAVGMFLGDQAGQIIGEKMGEWTTQLRDADIPGKIISAWDSTTEAIKSGWDGALKLMSDTWDKTKELGNAANDFVKDKTGIDVKAEVKNAYDDAVKYTANNIIPSLADLANKGADKLKQGAEWAGENTTLGKGAKAVVDSGLFDTTRKHRSKKSVSEIIQGGESGKEGYNAYNRGTGLGANGHRDLTNMTLADIQADQALPKSDIRRLMAVGKYQMMPSTLKEGAEALKLGSDTKFDEATQEKLFSQYLLGKKRPQIQDYITGKSDDAQAAQIAGAKEWRSIADPRTGKTYADKGASGNKASISSDDWLSSMDAAKKQYQENLKLGLNETEAYSKAVSGLQAVTVKAPAINEAETPATTPSIADDPIQAGRYKYETLEGGSVQVTDSQDGTIGLASDEQANAFRKQQGKPYLDSLAAANNPDSYSPGGVFSKSPALHDFVAGPRNTTQTAYAAAPKVPTFSPVSAPAEAPQIKQYLASNSDRNTAASAPSIDVGQDIKDRNIAHIVTGGFSGRG